MAACQQGAPFFTKARRLLQAFFLVHPGVAAIFEYVV